MKRILITPEIEALAHDYACHFLRKHSQTNVKQQLVKLGKQIEGLKTLFYIYARQGKKSVFSFF